MTSNGGALWESEFDARTSGWLQTLEAEGVAASAAGESAWGLFDVCDPATDLAFARVPDGDALAASTAVTAAASAFDGWSARAPRERSDLLIATFRALHEQRDALAALISRENGKPAVDALAEVSYAAEFFRWYAEEAVRDEGRYGTAPGGGARMLVRSRPVGVAALVTPWNFPLAMATRKIAPALAAGCTVVLKPAAETPLSALALASLMSAIGLPRGVVNVVPTAHPADVVDAWLTDDRVRKLSFTGSTRVGKALLGRAAGRVLNASMELGGNAPFVVTNDVDLDAAVEAVMQAKFRNGGQACTAANRIYVHRETTDEFVAVLGARVKKLVVAGARQHGAQIGPLISRAAQQRVGRVVDQALESGARVTGRASVPSGSGYFSPPTVLADVPPGHAILEEEIFGPVAPIVTYADDSDLPDLLNGTEYGLAGYVHSRDLRRAIRIAESLEVGMVGINRGVVSEPAAPFGGMKQSGLGREGGREGLREYQELQYLSIDLGDSGTLW